MGNLSRRVLCRARYSRLRCGIRVSTLLPFLFTYGGGVIRGQQLRALCLEIELGKRKKEEVCLSVSLVKRDRVRTRLMGLHGSGHVVHVCLEGCYVGENMVESSVQPCVVELFCECCGWGCKYDRRLLIQCERITCSLMTTFE